MYAHTLYNETSVWHDLSNRATNLHMYAHTYVYNKRQVLVRHVMGVITKAKWIELFHYALKHSKLAQLVMQVQNHVNVIYSLGGGHICTYAYSLKKPVACHP